VHREWSVWVGFMAVVVAAVIFVLGRDDTDSRSQLSAGTSVPSSTVAPSTTVTTVPPTTTSSPSTTAPPDTTGPPTTRRAPTPTTADDSPAPRPTAAPTTPAPTTPQPTRIQFGPGTYRVGVDLPAGAYRTDGGPSCFWARLSSFDGTAASVIAGQHTEGSAATVAIEPTDAGFSTAGCAVWLSV
jgi:hypothetical protein